MNIKQARQLLPLTIVMRDNDPNEIGTVTQQGISGFYVRWQNGDEGWIDYRDAKNISIR